MSSTRALFVASLALTLGAAAGSGDAVAQPKKAKPASACGVKLFPLTVGNTWTYQAVASPTPPDESSKHRTPPQPKQVTVTVASIETVAGKSVVHLTEQADERTLETTITCGAGVFQVAPESFFFAGEPGGYYDITLDKVDRKLVEGEGLGAPWSSAWREDIIAQWVAQGEKGAGELGKGKLELERLMSIRAAEQLNVIYGLVRGTKLEIEVTGRVTLDGTTKAIEMPANVKNLLWFTDGVGLVQVLNNYQHMYQLSAVTIVK
jgi:hypothetical protein